MTVYGLMKVWGTQFPEPSLVKLATTFGESSPMGVLWAFMGVSPPYCVFTGLVELLGAGLLISRRTTTLGAVVIMGAMGNVVMLNLCYDVPVKLHALHFLAGAGLLLAADGRRLVRVFILNRAAEARPLASIFVTPRLHRLGQYAKGAAVASVVLSSMATMTRLRAQFIDVDPPQLHGIWEVQRFETERADVSPWTQLVIANRGRSSLRVRTGARGAYKAHCADGTLVLTPRRDGDPRWQFDYDQPDDHHVTLTGPDIRIDLRRVDDSQFPLRTRGFHWVTDMPNHPWK